MFNPLSLIRKLGHATVNRIWRLGFATRFLFAILKYSATSFRRLPLTLREIYFSGVLSLLIIVVSGLFVGMVLGLQGYETLQRYGSTEALGILVALSLTRELGPVVAGLLFASRAGSSVTAEIGLMKSTEQLKAMDMMAVDPIARVVAPRFWGGVISMPLLAALFSAMGVMGGWLVWMTNRIDWIGMSSHKLDRAGLLAGGIAVACVLYFATLMATGLNLRQFARRV